MELQNLSLCTLRAMAMAVPLSFASGASAASDSAPLGFITNQIVVSAPIVALCDVSKPLRPAAAVPAYRIAQSSKNSAILGGEMSALERIKLKQSQSAQTLAMAVPPSRPEPAANGIRSAANVCAKPNRGMSSASPITSVSKGSSNDYLASKRVRIGKTSFDRDWRRVSRQSKTGIAEQLFGNETNTSLATLKTVNQWVNREIRYVEDRELFGRADYWAGAGMTVAIRKGDCEDIALTKMQILADAGFDRSDMFLTIARDTVRRADHALLVVRIDGRYLVLDNTTDALLDGAYSHDYAPVLSFSSNNKWVHGY